MLKKILFVFAVVLVVTVTSIYIFRANIKRYAINTILKSFPLPNVALADVNFDESSGRLNLEDLKVKNPRGFINQYMMEADSINMNINIVTKPDLLLNISQIDITNPVFYIERARNGTWNFEEFSKRNKTAKIEKKRGLDFISEAFAQDNGKKSHILFPSTININNGALRISDSFVSSDKTHSVDLYPLAGTFLLDYSPASHKYEKISFQGKCNINGDPASTIKGNIDIFPESSPLSYVWDFNAYNIPLSTLKPYLDRYTPFIVKQGSFNMASDVRSVNGAINGDYTMELADLLFDVNPNKSNIPFLETSVKKMTLYLTNQKGNVIIDFKQKGQVGGKINWELGPIAKRAIGLMVIDTVIDVIGAIEKGSKSDPLQALPNDVPPEVIDIFREIFK
ncbi:MAG: DUF748 domain-containing protein [Candidatus Omnitrophica bacterium]|nr:DUF748 domain-containing protein [Candidatus Omnitrophota bacterium]